MHMIELAVGAFLLTLFFGLYAYAFATRPRDGRTKWTRTPEVLGFSEALKEAA